jgi:hypothetical protein
MQSGLVFGIGISKNQISTIIQTDKKEEVNSNKFKPLKKQKTKNVRDFNKLKNCQLIGAI